MQKLTMGLVLIIIILIGVAGYLLASQNYQLIPSIKISNNTTTNSSHSSNSDITKTSKSSSTTSKTKTNSTKTNSTKPPVTNGTKGNNSI